MTAQEMIQQAHAVAVAEPVAVHQWRKRLCADWYEGNPDHEDGGGPYETRALYAAPPQREPLTEAQIDAACLTEPEALYDIAHSDQITAWQFREQMRKVARAIERAHGITKEQL